MEIVYQGVMPLPSRDSIQNALPRHCTSLVDREVKRAAAPKLTLYPYTPTVSLYDLLADGQTDARARVLFSGVQTLEDHKYALGILGIDADAVIADGKDPFIPLLFRRDMHPGWPPNVDNGLRVDLKIRIGGVCTYD